MLAELAAGRYYREEHTIFTQVQGPLGEVKPLRPALVYCTAWRVHSTRELRELEVAIHGYGEKTALELLSVFCPRFDPPPGLQSSSGV